MNIIERIRLRWKWVALQGKPIPWWEYGSEPISERTMRKLLAEMLHKIGYPKDAATKDIKITVERGTCGEIPSILPSLPTFRFKAKLETSGGRE